MLFEKLIEQHGVDLIVAYAVDLALFVANHEIRIYPLHVFGYESELQCAVPDQSPSYSGRSRVLVKRERRWPHPSALCFL